MKNAVVFFGSSSLDLTSKVTNSHRTQLIIEYKGRRPLQAPNRLIAEFNMGCYGYRDSVSQRVLIGAHVKFSD